MVRPVSQELPSDIDNTNIRKTLEAWLRRCMKRKAIWIKLNLVDRYGLDLLSYLRTLNFSHFVSYAFIMRAYRMRPFATIIEFDLSFSASTPLHIIDRNLSSM